MSVVIEERIYIMERFERRGDLDCFMCGRRGEGLKREITYSVARGGGNGQAA